MPAQKISTREKQSLELLKKMEPSNLSPKELYIERVKEINNDNTNSIVPEAASQSELNKQEDVPQKVTLSEWITIIILCFVNLINYMDRFTIAGEYTLYFPHLEGIYFSFYNILKFARLIKKRGITNSSNHWSEVFNRKINVYYLFTNMVFKKI